MLLNCLSVRGDCPLSCPDGPAGCVLARPVWHNIDHRLPVDKRHSLNRGSPSDAPPSTAAQILREGELRPEWQVLAHLVGDILDVEPDHRAVARLFINIAPLVVTLLERAIDALPDEFRTVLVARVIGDMSIDETADLLGLRPETVKTRLHRARRLLKAALADHVEPMFSDVFPFAASLFRHKPH